MLLEARGLRSKVFRSTNSGGEHQLLCVGLIQTGAAYLTQELNVSIRDWGGASRAFSPSGRTLEQWIRRLVTPCPITFGKGIAIAEPGSVQNLMPIVGTWPGSPRSLLLHVGLIQGPGRQRLAAPRDPNTSRTRVDVSRVLLSDRNWPKASTEAMQWAPGRAASCGAPAAS